MIIFIILSFLTIGPNFLYTIKSNKSITETIPLTYFLVIILMFISGNFWLLKQTSYLVLICCAVCYLFGFILIIKEGNISCAIKRIFDPSFVIWIIILFIIMLFNINISLFHWDDFSHWGDIVKVMYTINDFGTNPESLSLAKSYPPGISLFELYFETLNGCFDESLLFMSYQIFVFSLIISFTNKLKWKNQFSWIKTCAYIIIILIINNIFIPTFTQTIMVDSAMAVLFAYSILCVYTTEKYDTYRIIKLCLSLVVLTLSKDIGIAFALGVIVIVAFDMFLFKKDQRNFNRTKIFLIPVLIASVFLFWILWKIKCIGDNVESQDVAFSNLPLIIDAFLGKYTSYYYEVVEYFIHNLKYSYLTDGKLVINTITAIFIMFLFSVIAVMIAKKEEKKKIVAYFSLIIIGCLLYFILIAILYMLMFSHYEAINLQSWPRYIGTYLQSILIVIACICFYNSDNNKFNYLTVCLLIFALLCCPTSQIKFTYNNKENWTNQKSIRVEQTSIVNKLLNEEKKNIYFISQGNNGIDLLHFKYDWRQNISKINKFNIEESWSIGPKINEKDIHTNDFDPESWLQLMLNEDYELLYIYNTDDRFKLKYGMLFEDQDQINNNTLFLIDKNTRKIVKYKGGNN